jgi:hypothetical protein
VDFKERLGALELVNKFPQKVSDKKLPLPSAFD